MVRLCPMPHTAERCAQALAQRCQRILDPRGNDWIHGSRHETITLHLSQSLGQHLLADSIHQLRQATEPNHSMLCQSLQQKQGPLVRNAADNLFHQTINLRRSTHAFRGLESYQIDTAFAAFGLGWHYEAGIQFIRLILAGVFDKYPDLQVILGHWGEVVLFYLKRLGSLARVTNPIADYFKQNLYVTPSGMWSQSYLQRTLEVVGPERILFSTDYPYQYRPGKPGPLFIEEAALSPEQRELFAHGNWERLMQSVRRS
jgi:hypothetical protein